MPKDWRVAVLWGAVIVFAAWILWWASAGYPLDGPICFDEITRENCPRYNVIVYSLWRFAELVSHWAALIAAIFTGALTIFAVRLWRSTDKLWKTTDDSLKHAEIASKKELRAYAALSRSG